MKTDTKTKCKLGVSLFSFALIGIMAFLLLPISAPMAIATTDGDWMYPLWGYRQQFTVFNSVNETLTNYQVKLTLIAGTGTSSGTTVYLNGHAKADFGDIRFTNADGQTLLHYWLESFASGSSAVVWVELDSLPVSSSANFYIYYGCTDAETSSSGNDTFIAFDDFENSTIGELPVSWYEFENPDNGTCVTIASGYSGKGVQCTANATSYSAVRNNLSIQGHYRLLGWFKHPDGKGELYLGNTPYVLSERADSWSNYFRYIAKDTVWTDTSILKDTDWHLAEWVVDGLNNSFSFSIDGNTPNTGEIYGSSSNITVWGGRFQEPGTIILDQLIATNYVSPAPSITAWAAEEERPDMTPPAAIDDLVVSNLDGDTLVLTWTATGDDGYVGVAASYDIRYAASPITNDNWASATQLTGGPAPLSAGSKQAVIADNLTAGTYFFAIRAVDENGNESDIFFPHGTIE